MAGSQLDTGRTSCGTRVAEGKEGARTREHLTCVANDDWILAVIEVLRKYRWVGQIKASADTAPKLSTAGMSVKLRRGYGYRTLVRVFMDNGVRSYSLWYLH